MSTRGTTPRARSTGRQALLWIVKIGVSVGLLWLLFSRIDTTSLWRLMRGASLAWMGVALGLYLVMLMVSTWRWRILLRTQHVHVPFGSLVNSYLAATFANNFLPSNIGGDVIRIADTARATGSKTLATAVVLADRGVGVLGLAFVAACGSTLAARHSEAIGPVGPSLLWGALAAAVAACFLVLTRPERLGAMVRPLRAFHAEWVDRRIETMMGALQRFRRAPGTMVVGVLASIAVQAILVAFYAAVAAALHIVVPIGHLAILVPVSGIVQMVPVSVNGLGVREGTFVGYLTRISVPKESAVALSLFGAALVMLFSISGAAAYLARRHNPDLD